MNDNGQNKNKRPRWKTALIWIGAILAGLIGLLLLVLVVAGLIPIQVEDPLVSAPAGSYEEALDAIQIIQAHEEATPDLFPECRSFLRTHDEKVENTVVFFHGFTSCPEQLRELSEKFYDEGYNVYVPLQPYHGHTDRKGEILRNLTAEELAAFATETADIAQGLGENVVVAGLSGGGSLAVWLAQERDDIDLAVPMAPFVGIKLAPGVFLNKGFTNILQVIPNFYRWWDPIKKEDSPASAPYTYVGYPFRSMGEYMKLGFSAEREAEQSPAAAGDIIMITNGNETSISNGVASHLVEMWNKQQPGKVETYEFDKSLKYPHDFISPDREGTDPESVYPILLELLGGSNP